MPAAWRFSRGSLIRTPTLGTSSRSEEATTETRAVVLGGVTTIGVFLREIEESYLDHLPSFRRAIDERS